MRTGPPHFDGHAGAPRRQLAAVGTPSGFAGRLSLVSISDLLETMQANNNTGELRLKTDFGSATVWFENGQLLDAKIGSFQGEAAVFRLLGLTDGSFEIRSMPVNRSRVITQPVRALLRRRSQRSVEWKALVEKLPPLGTVLVLDLEKFSSASAGLSDEELATVQLVDGRRAIFEIIDDSGRDAVEVLRQIDKLIIRGLVSADADAPGGVGYDAKDGESGIIPPSRAGGPPSKVAPPPSKVAPPPSNAALPPPSKVALPPPIAVSPPSKVAPPPPKLAGPPSRAAEAEPAPSVAANERAPAVAAGDAPPSSTTVMPPHLRPSTIPLAPTSVRGGPKLGRYEVLSRLGRGGMGTVYLARITGDGGFRRLFAIKVLRSHLSRSDEATQMLLKEARIASRVDHPNIVSVVDVGSHEGQPYIVMDYVTGCSLADLLKSSSSRASTAAAVSIILDTLAGLHAAHTLADDDGIELDVIHHDVSPHNVMVGLDGIARLSDFGVAYVRRLTGEEEETSRGKPAFTAPERVSGGPGDRRSDLFSVGVILWNALTGASLFEGNDIETTLENVLTKPIPPASRFGRSPESLDAICFKALQRSPQKRYQTAEEMLVHLRKVAAAEDLLGSPSEVKQWVKEAMGHELDVQRLSFLDAARMAREAEAGESSNLLPTLPRHEEGPPSDVSRTIELASQKGGPARPNNVAKWLAVAVGIGIVLLAVLLPDTIKNLGKRKAPLKEPAGSTVISAPGEPSAPAPSNVTPGGAAPSRPSSPRTPAAPPGATPAKLQGPSSDTANPDSRGQPRADAPDAGR
jgi:eukaryotic-like serine/threonine-protein kinase